MKNKEIEELLNELKQHLEYQKEVSDIDSNVAYLRLTIKKYKLLLSYIEQLENRNKELYEGFMATQEELTDYATKNENLTKVIEDFKNKALEKSKWFKMVYQDEDGMKHIYDDKNWVIEKINKILGVDK